MTPSIEDLQAIWCKHTTEQFRTWHEAAMRAAWEAGKEAALEGAVDCWVTMRVGFGGRPETPQPYQRKFYYDKQQADSAAWAEYVIDLEVRPAWIVVGAKQ